MGTASMESHDQQLQSDFTLSAPATKKDTHEPTRQHHKQEHTHSGCHPFIHRFVDPSTWTCINATVRLSVAERLDSCINLLFLALARSSLSRSDCEALSSWCTHQLSLVFPHWRLFCFVAGTRTGLGSQQKLVGPNIRGHPSVLVVQCAHVSA